LEIEVLNDQIGNREIVFYRIYYLGSIIHIAKDARLEGLMKLLEDIDEVFYPPRESLDGEG